VKVVAIANQKGGVGKTTTAVNLAACLARNGRRVLLLDLDQQVNATQYVGAQIPASEADSSFALLVEQKPDTRRFIQPVSPNLSLIPAHIALAELDLKLASAVNPDGRLRRALEQVAGDYDYVLLDCPPSLGRATINALVAASHLIVAVETAWFAYSAVERLVTIVDEVIEQSNPRLEIYALATLHRQGVKMHAQVLERVREVFRERAFDTCIRHTVAFVESAAAGQPIVDYANGSRGHQDYQALAKEVISRVEAKQAGHTAVAN
jgi:chromosome partitioning protein